MSEDTYTESPNKRPSDATDSPGYLEVHVFLECSSQCEGAEKLKALALEIEKAAVRDAAGNFTFGFRTGCDRYKNRREWRYDDGLPKKEDE